MKHSMSIYERPFLAIKSKTKHIEVRCNDEKRKLISIGDEITFFRLPDEVEVIHTRVLSLYPFDSFEKLYTALDFSEFGCEGSTLQVMIDNTRKIFSQEREMEQGVLGIRIEVIE